MVRNSVKIACEIAVSNAVEYEVKNILKCLKAGYSWICIISKDEGHLEKIKGRINNGLGFQSKIHFFVPDQMTEFLDSFIHDEKSAEVKRTRGYRVRVNFKVVDPT